MYFRNHNDNTFYTGAWGLFWPLETRNSPLVWLAVGKHMHILGHTCTKDQRTNIRYTCQAARSATVMRAIEEILWVMDPRVQILPMENPIQLSLYCHLAKSSLTSIWRSADCANPQLLTIGKSDLNAKWRNTNLGVPKNAKMASSTELLPIILL